MGAGTLHLREFFPDSLGVLMSDEFKNLVTGLYDLLVPIADTDMRKRAVKSALVMLGDDPSFVERKPTGGGGAASEHGDSEEHGEFNAKARTWMAEQADRGSTRTRLSHRR